MKPEFKVGDKVNYHAVIGEGVTSTGHVVQWIEPSDIDGKHIWISGETGWVVLGALSHIEPPDVPRAGADGELTIPEYCEVFAKLREEGLASLDPVEEFIVCCMDDGGKIRSESGWDEFAGHLLAAINHHRAAPPGELSRLDTWFPHDIGLSVIAIGPEDEAHWKSQRYHKIADVLDSLRIIYSGSAAFKDGPRYIQVAINAIRKVIASNDECRTAKSQTESSDDALELARLREIIGRIAKQSTDCELKARGSKNKTAPIVLDLCIKACREVLQPESGASDEA